MTKRVVHIEAGHGYDVTIGSGLLFGCGRLLQGALPRCRVAVITDSNVKELYLDRVAESLKNAGFSVCSFAFPAGEGSKNICTLSDILEFLAAERLTRADCVIALGGGVVGDMAGFAAGCFLRGVRYVQLPTTLLAAVDSSVGGKTAIDLAAGKNLAGLFLQPSAVICDTDTFSTLPPEALADGAAEAIKTGVLAGEELLSLLESGDAAERLPEIVEACVRHKGYVVEEDEFEHGLRKTLNLGHTVGHAIEKLSGYSIPHGHAVASGMAIIMRAGEKLGYAAEPMAGRVCSALKRFGLPAGTDFSAEELAKAALSDKKRTALGITLAIPERPGDCRLVDIPVEKLGEIISAGLEE